VTGLADSNPRKRQPDGYHVLETHSTVNHSRHEIAQYPESCLTCLEEFNLCACPERCEIHE
jgi:hypothetical protein